MLEPICLTDTLVSVSIGSLQVSISAKHILVCPYLELYESVIRTNLASSKKCMIMFSQLFSNVLEYRLYSVHKGLLT